MSITTIFRACVISVAALVVSGPAASSAFGADFPWFGKRNSSWFFAGDLEAGLYVNSYGQTNRYVDGFLDPTSANTGLLNNVRQSDFQLNQIYLYGGKKLETDNGFDLGGQIDFMYGTDSIYGQAAGLEYDTSHGDWRSGDYTYALPQTYLEMGYKDVSVKVGKIASPLGYESLISSERFFYSTSYSFNVAPNTHAGVVANWDINSRVSIFGGWVNGGDKFFDTSKDNAFLGGVEYQLSCKTTLAYTLLAGRDNQWNDNNNYFVNTLVIDHKLNKNWEYVFEWTLNSNDADAWYDNAYGINQELFYRWNRCWGVGGRVEWMHFNPGADFVDVSDNAYAFTLGLNWTPCERLIIRPEIRYDRFENERLFDALAKKDQFSGGCSMVVTF